MPAEADTPCNRVSHNQSFDPVVAIAAMPMMDSGTTMPSTHRWRLLSFHLRSWLFSQDTHSKRIDNAWPGLLGFAAMTTSTRRSTLQTHGEEVLETALGRAHRPDPELPGTGGPAGNARLTAWVGLVLLVLFLAELVTTLNVRGLITWHLVIGVLLIPPALLKTASTGYRMVQYYTGRPTYVESGPPPMFLRLLGPLVVLSTLGLLGTGVWIVLAGEQASRSELFTVGPLRVDHLLLHQSFFATWCVATGLHVLARLVPAWQLVGRGVARVAGGSKRLIVVLLALVLSGGAGLYIASHPNGWTHATVGQRPGPPPQPGG